MTGLMSRIHSQILGIFTRNGLRIEDLLGPDESYTWATNVLFLVSNQRERLKPLTWAKEKMNWMVA